MDEREKELKAMRRRIKALESADSLRRKAEQTLAASEKKYRTIFENTGTATMIMEKDTTISMVNTEFEKISGYSREEVEGIRRWPEMVVEADRERMLGYHFGRRQNPASAPRNYECRLRIKSGATKTCTMTVAMIPGTTTSVASINDISGQRKLEKRILKLAEIERQKIGQDLHDDLAPHLVGVEALSALLGQRLGQQNHSDAALAAEIRTLIGDAIAKTRSLARGLWPVALDERGLVAALKNLAKSVEKLFSIVCTLAYDEKIRIRDNIVATHLYHIVRESVNNAVRHGGAARIDIRLADLGAAFRLTIADNGCGLKTSSGRKNGLGLEIMQYRAKMIGATLGIESEPDNGTCVTCTIDRKYIS